MLDEANCKHQLFKEKETSRWWFVGRTREVVFLTADDAEFQNDYDSDEETEMCGVCEETELPTAAVPTAVPAVPAVHATKKRSTTPQGAAKASRKQAKTTHRAPPESPLTGSTGSTGSVGSSGSALPIAPPLSGKSWGPNNMFHESEVTHTIQVKKHKKMIDVILSKLVVDSTGASTIRLMGGCRGTCKNQCVDLQTYFTPTDCMKNVRKHQFFLQGVQGFQDAVQRGDGAEARRCRQQAEDYKSTVCQPCRDVHKKVGDKRRKPCKDFYRQVRREECLKNNGCCNADCPMRFSTNPLVEFMTEGDHVHTSKELDPLLRKETHLSYFQYWATHGGVEGMKRELAKGFNWPCAFCHQLEKTTASANKFKHRNWESMPDGSKSKDATPEEKKQAEAKNSARIRCEIVYPKMEYVDKIKRTDPRFKGQCACCSRKVLRGEEHCFHFDHIVEATKLMGGWAGKDGGVGGLVNNSIKATSLTKPKFKAVLDAEIAKCRLLCINCHKVKTNKRIRFNDETQEWEVVVKVGDDEDEEEEEEEDVEEE